MDRCSAKARPSILIPVEPGGSSGRPDDEQCGSTLEGLGGHCMSRFVCQIHLARVVLLMALAAGSAHAEEVKTVLQVRLDRPDEQLTSLLALFKDSPAPHPAAALAMWREATGDPEILNKTQQALIAALNPEMVSELRTLEGASAYLVTDGDDQLGWELIIPADDGTWAALITAAVLTDGKAEPPLESGEVVDRLGPPGSWLVARQGSRLVLAANRDRLAKALARLDGDAEPLPKEGLKPGIRLRLNPEALANSDDWPAQAIGGGLSTLGIQELQTELRIEGDSFDIQVQTQLDPDANTSAVIDPAWLDAIPSENVSLAFAIAIDPEPSAWNRLFDVADRIEKVDPSRAKAAPIRPRLNLLANLAGIQPEVDLWPQLRGVSGFLLSDDQAQPLAALIAWHAKDEATAIRWHDVVFPRLGRVFGLNPTEEPGSLGRVAGQPLILERLGSTVRIGWGKPALTHSRKAMAAPEHSSGPSLRAAWDDQPISRFGAFWPGRAFRPSETDLAGPAISAAIADAPAVLWWGQSDLANATAYDQIRWGGLSATIQRALENLPRESPPDSATQD